MNAFRIYDIAFDSAADFSMHDTHDKLVQYVKDVAFADDDAPALSDEIAEAIVAAHESYKGLDEDAGEYENAFWHKVRKPLSEIEL